MSTEREAARPRRRERRVLILWGLGMLLLTALGFVLLSLVLPFLRAREAVSPESLGNSMTMTCDAGPFFRTGRWRIDPEAGARAVASLGGQVRAARTIRIYLLAPKSVAPRKGHAARLLGFCGEPALSTILDCVRAGEEPAGINAAFALINLAGPDGSTPPFGAPRGNPAARKSVPGLLEIFETGNARARFLAAGALVAIRPDPRAVVPRLERIVRGGDLEHRVAAAAILGDFLPESRPVIRLAIADPESAVRTTALDAAYAGTFPRVTEPDLPVIAECLTHEDPEMRLSACHILGRLRQYAAHAVPSLVAVQDDPDPQMRAAVRRALALIAPPDALPVPELSPGVLMPDAPPGAAPEATGDE